MNLYLKLLKAKAGDSKALEDIVKSYEIFTNIQIKCVVFKICNSSPVINQFIIIINI